MKINRNEISDHYDFYVNNCTGNEIPISFEQWAREYQNDLEIIVSEVTV